MAHLQAGSPRNNADKLINIRELFTKSLMISDGPELVVLAINVVTREKQIRLHSKNQNY